AVEERSTDRRRLPLLEFAEAGLEPRLLFGRHHQVERARGVIVHVFGAVDRLRAATLSGRTQPVDRAVARDSHQPGDWARARRIEARGLAPNRYVDVLQHILGLASVIQDTQADAKKLRRGVLVNNAQSRTVARGNAYERGGKLAAGRGYVHATTSCRAAPANGAAGGEWPDVSHTPARASPRIMRVPQPERLGNKINDLQLPSAAPWELAVAALDHKRPKSLRRCLHVAEIDQALGRSRHADVFIPHVPCLHIE